MAQFSVLSGGVSQKCFDDFRKSVEYAEKLVDLQVSEFPDECPDVEIIEGEKVVWTSENQELVYVNYCEAEGVSDTFDTEYECSKDALEKFKKYGSEVSVYSHQDNGEEDFDIDDCTCVHSFNSDYFDIEQEFIVPFNNRLGKEFTITRADYEGLPCPMKAFVMSDEEMEAIAEEIGFQMEAFNFDEDREDDVLEEKMNEKFWEYMEDVALHTGMTYYEDEDED